MPKSSNRGLRLIVLTPLFPPAVGGAAEDFQTLSSAWNQMTAVEQVLIVTERCAGAPNCEARGKVQIRRMLPARDSRPDLGRTTLLIRTVATYLHLALFLAAHPCGRNCQAVLVHGRYAKRIFIKFLVLLRIRVNVFLSDLCTSPEQLVDADVIICNSEAVYRRARNVLPPTCNLQLIPVAFEFAAPQNEALPGVHAASPYFLFVGNVCRAKGVDVLIKAFAIFQQRHAGYRLLLAGPVCEPWLLDEAPSSVIPLGVLNHSDLLVLMRRAQAVVLPSRSESLPRVCLEAMALGAKVICPPGIPEFERAFPEWCLRSVSVPEVLEKLEQALTAPFEFSFDFAKYDPWLVAQQILDVCQGAATWRAEPQLACPK